MLVRGGPGTGKSVLAADLALRMARAVGGDVLYACVEILPSEVLAQRMGFEGFDPTKAIDLARPEARKASGDGPTLVVGMTEMEMSSTEEGDVPDVGRMILDLCESASNADVIRASLSSTLSAMATGSARECRARPWTGCATGRGAGVGARAGRRGG